MSVLALDAPISPAERAVFTVGIVFGAIGFGMCLWFGFRGYSKRPLRPFHWILAVVGFLLAEFGWGSFGSIMTAGPDPPPRPPVTPAMRGPLISTHAAR